MKKLIVASNNKHKISEIKDILKDFDLEIVSLKDMNIDIDVVEDGDTFMENSYKKAYEISEYLKKNDINEYLVMADDSGLMIDSLDGRPGVYSARYAGEHGNDLKNNLKVLEEMKLIPFDKRTARFVCAIVLISSNGLVIKAEGKTEGFIEEEMKGDNDFGYDPLFYVKEFDKTFAEISSEEKNSISHRGRALEILKKKMIEEGIV